MRVVLTLLLLTKLIRKIIFLCILFLEETEFFEFPNKYAGRIQAENLTHIHFDEAEEWNSDSTVQWNCTSGTHIVYSAYRTQDGNYKFVIQDFLLREGGIDRDAHDNYKKEDIKWYLDNAVYLRNT